MKQKNKITERWGEDLMILGLNFNGFYYQIFSSRVTPQIIYFQRHSDVLGKPPSPTCLWILLDKKIIEYC